MGPFRSLLETEAKMERFREWFYIIEDVEVVPPPPGFVPSPEDNVLLIPLLWVFEVGIRFPLHRIFREFLAYLGLTPAQ